MVQQKHHDAVTAIGTIMLMLASTVRARLHMHSQATIKAAPTALTANLPPWLQFRHSSWPLKYTEDIQSQGIDSSPTAWHSQSSEDVYAYQNFFYNTRGGSYLEMGALDGVRFSNTKTFHDSLGWTGLLIEANPANYGKLIGNRPGDLCVHAAICEAPQIVHYVSKAAVGGIWELMSPTFKETWHPNVDVASLPEIPCLPLGPVLAKFGIKRIDFFSLDVEGGELAVLRSIDWDFTRFGVVAVEADGTNIDKNSAVQSLMLSKGFRYHGRFHRSDWFIAEDFVASAKRDDV